MKYITYKVTARKSNGQLVTKKIDAQNEEAARIEALRYGRPIRVVQMKEGLFSKIKAKILKRVGLNAQGRMEFLQTISNMLVGYNLNEALSVMIQNFSGPIREVSRRLRYETIIKQKDPVDALGELGPKFFPSVTVAIIRSNSKVSKLNEAFREGLNFEREMTTLQKGQMMKVYSSGLWFVIACLMSMGAHWYGWDLMEEVNYFAMMPEKGSSVDMLNDLKYQLAVLGWSAAAIFSAWFSVLLFLMFAPDLVSAERAQKVILKMPLVNGVVLSRLNFVACYQIQKLMSKGVPQMAAFKYVSQEQEDGVLKADLERVQGLLKEGSQDWVDGFHSFSDLDRALLKSSTSLEEMADVFGAQSDQFLQKHKDGISGLFWVHWIFAGGLLLPFVVILTLLFALPMIGGFELADQVR
ncbi:MAG: hypothetical protein CL840_03670 [Crocinitomicaceae bacterium]|nr:hypothetical protein [Crocinitomicaceae bacterium]|tara:strand:+ start:276061 stop:277293 length:1233 start_codon:yes stop_codon:yes gene_type:complete